MPNVPVSSAGKTKKVLKPIDLQAMFPDKIIKVGSNEICFHIFFFIGQYRRAFVQVSHCQASY
jgi:hypothetical protein